MIRVGLTSAALFVALTGAAFAQAANWNVTEISGSGIKSASGAWALKTEGDAVSGTATLQFDNGKMLDYKLDGKVAGGVYTVNLNERTDGKKSCVWTGAPVADSGGRVISGPVECQGSKFSIRAGLQ